MRTPRLLLTLILPFASLGAAGPAAVEQWGTFEVALKGPADGNPFLDVRLSAVFTDGGRMIEVPGFYDGEGVYRIRFMPTVPGSWRYDTRSNRWELTDKSGVFTVVPPRAGNRGPVGVRDTYHFAYADGTPFKPVGTTVYSWIHRPEEMQRRTLRTLAGAPFNKVRMLVFPQAHGVRHMPVERWPFAGTPPRGWDFTRFNPAFFRHLEARIADLRDLGIECDLILFHPYDDAEGWGFETMDRETDERYLRYVVARLAAYRNVWWSIANEFDFLRTKTEADWDRYLQVVRDSDPCGHLRSIHNGRQIYDHNKPWITHVSMQNALAAEEPGRATLYRDVYRKPVIYDELKYEGSHHLRWARLSGPELVRNFWSCTVAGTYGGHGEYFADEREVVWLAQGGELKGESAPRLAFLRRVLEEGPARGLNPSDHWQDPRMAGEPGRYYLIYFGADRPTSWAVRLYRTALVEGMEFSADVLDTWNMAVTPVPGVFTTRKGDAYFFTDRDGREIPLPGRPWQAIRLRWSGGAAPLDNVKPPIEP
jgi:hypothetical protein